MYIKIRIPVIAFLIAAVTAFTACMLFSKSIYTPVSTTSPGVKLPIIMYHQISRKGDNTGAYVVSEKELESDLAYLSSNGFTAVTVKEITDYVENGKKLPEKPVMLTFDDGYETGYTILYPLLKKYNMKAVVSVVGAYTDEYTSNGDHNDRYSYLNWEEVSLLSASPEIEIQNHSYDMHYSQKGKRKGINKKQDESSEAYFKNVGKDIRKMQELLLEKAGCEATAMTYPFGEYCKDTEKLCREIGFKCTFSCEEKINIIKKDRPESLYNLGRYNRKSGASPQDFFGRIFDV